MSHLFIKLHGAIGLYGFTRGYRARDESNTKDLLMGDRLLNGIMNGYMYCIPIYNMKWIHCFINRLEVKYRNLDKNEYQENYKELCGICDDTV